MWSSCWCSKCLTLFFLCAEGGMHLLRGFTNNHSSWAKEDVINVCISPCQEHGLSLSVDERLWVSFCSLIQHMLVVNSFYVNLLNWVRISGFETLLSFSYFFFFFRLADYSCVSCPWKLLGWWNQKQWWFHPGAAFTLEVILELLVHPF